ncbi:DEAD/DEAH box helicase domain-containing protein [Desulfocicer vacuolatum DSM 3385]|uniref:DEAD/DEAH box helicase domain-containing protein n=1 Tax=Desulfocicer vacuolatum DSM 3385 TaxID=1121400 RepID=A0A1W2B8W7_9BACT|nr:DEAD/DEAH box helicase [Desulfocicer vacuolatum]SMC69230.1 DEAD/DEAH box helicase domain-containing protein [Desulfocicer vacuolatum DSM 3385]
MSLAEYIESLKKYKVLGPDIVYHRTLPARGACYARESGVTNPVKAVIKRAGIPRLYAHQERAVALIKKGIHTVVATPTASGKSLIYNLPVLESLLENKDSRALYLFPLKALARDQLGTLQKLFDDIAMDVLGKGPFTAAVYDGDLSSHARTRIRNAPPHALLTNPEMLHLAMLAHHRLWEPFFKNLKFVVVDEVHTYRGVMGSHMAWVFRRLRRICRHYGSDPVFVFSSATIDNPRELAADLTGLCVELINESGAPCGEKEILLMGGMAGAAQTAIQLMHAAIHRNLRTIVYTQSRKITELIAMWASQRAGALASRISAYRAGFLPGERRDIEDKLASGELLAVVSTSALELGIDIGNLDLCILVGYPGTIMSTWQRAGRVGRDGGESAMIFVAHEDALDHYFMNNPKDLFDMPPEKAVINPLNPVIMARHLECAAADLALVAGEDILQESGVAPVLDRLERDATLLKSAEGSTWFSARKSPHRRVSLRGTGTTVPIFLSGTRTLLGHVDKLRAFYETHEGAVYIHHGNTHVVNRFDPEKCIVEVTPQVVGYYTRARSVKSTEILEETSHRALGNTRMGFGTLRVTDHVTGYERKAVGTGKSLGIIPLDFPPNTFETQGVWIEIPDEIKAFMESNRYHFMGGIHAMEHAAIGILPLLVMTDRNDLGGISIPFHPQISRGAVFIYDGTPGGIGLSRQAFHHGDLLLKRTLDVIASCKCDNGCPACVHSPKCGSGNRPIDKTAALKILEQMQKGALKGKNRLSPPNKTRGSASGVMERVGNFISSVRKSRTNELHGDFELQKTVVRQSDKFTGEERGLFAEEEKKILKTEGHFRYGVLDLETRRSAKEVGGWHRARDMGVSCVVVYDSHTDIFKEYLQEDIPALVKDLAAYDLVVGFNIIRFDYQVLSGLSHFDFSTLPTLDLLKKVHEKLGYRLSLDRLAKETLGAQKSADGLLALKWWKEGKIRKIIDYCIQDVLVTRDLYRFGRDNDHLLFRNKAGHQVRLPVKW